MKVLYIIRLFSGFESSINKSKWAPTGVPTIYKALEGFEKNFDLHVILNKKHGYSILKKNKSRRIKFNNFKNEFQILKNIDLKFFSKKINKILTEIYQILYHLKIFYNTKPDIIYFDNSNIISSFIFTNFFKKPTFLRIMGVNPIMKNYYKERDIKSWIYKRLYNSKFHSVIATQDGSGTERWMKKAININSNQYILINGVNKEKINKKENQSKTINFCFIGKLEKQKGINEFINTAIKFLNKDKKAKFTIVGEGSLFQEISSKISINNFQKEIDLIRHLDHKKIYDLLNRIDVYVSLNKYGNLSNTNLEAISLNKAMVILDSDKESEIDLFVDEFLPPNSVIRIDRNNIEESLFKTFVKISENKRVVSNLSKNIKLISNKLEPWDDRINKEIKIILKAYVRKT